MSRTNATQVSKAMSLLLRHQPEAGGVTLDPQGWVAVDDLIRGLAQLGRKADRELIACIVAESDKQRFTIDGDRIRANQGHSVAVDLGLVALEPPAVLFHGTVERFLASIMRDGLERRQRHHVHLAADVAGAVAVGHRRGQAIVLRVDAATMRRDGHDFFRSANGVWLTEHVPLQYLRRSEVGG